MTQMIWIDWLALSLIPLFTVLTPTKSRYFNVNVILTAEICIALGYAGVLHYIDSNYVMIYDGAWFYLSQMIYAFGFSFLFWKYRDNYLAVVFSCVGVFQLLNSVGLEYNYQAVMAIFIVMEIMLCFRGMLNGLLEKYYHDNMWHALDRRSAKR